MYAFTCIFALSLKAIKNVSLFSFHYSNNELWPCGWAAGWLSDWVAYRPAGISASYFWRIACNAGMLHSILPSVAIFHSALSFCCPHYAGFLFQVWKIQLYIVHSEAHTHFCLWLHAVWHAARCNMLQTNKCMHAFSNSLSLRSATARKFLRSVEKTSKQSHKKAMKSLKKIVYYRVKWWHKSHCLCLHS